MSFRPIYSKLKQWLITGNQRLNWLIIEGKEKPYSQWPLACKTRCLQKTKKSRQTEFNKLKSKQSRRPEKLRGILLLQESVRNAELYYILPSTLEILSQKRKEIKTQQEIKLSGIWLELIRDCEQGRFIGRNSVLLPLFPFLTSTLIFTSREKRKRWPVNDANSTTTNCVFRSFNSAIGVIEKFQIWTLSHRITTNPLI